MEKNMGEASYVKQKKHYKIPYDTEISHLFLFLWERAVPPMDIDYFLRISFTRVVCGYSFLTHSWSFFIKR